MGSKKIGYTLPDGSTDSWYISGTDNQAAFKTAMATAQYNAALAKQQNDWNIAQWHRENEYNSPSQQVQRLMAAGINPLLIDVNGNSAASSPSAVGYPMEKPQTFKDETFQRILDGAKNVADTTLDALRYRNEVSKLALDTRMNEAQLNKMNDDHFIQEMTWQNSNWLNHEFAIHHYSALSHKNIFDHQSMENDVFKSGIDDLKKIGHVQLQKLSQDLENAKLTGKALEFANELREKYGIDTSSDFWTNFISAGLRDPENYQRMADGLGRAINGLIRAGKTSVKNSIKSMFDF